MDKKNAMLPLAVAALIVGLLLIVAGRLIGTLLFLAAGALIIIYAMKMNRIAGNSNGHLLTGEMGGYGRQQSEVLKLDPKDAAAPAGNIWDALENPQKEGE